MSTVDRSTHTKRKRRNRAKRERRAARARPTFAQPTFARPPELPPAVIERLEAWKEVMGRRYEALEPGPNQIKLQCPWCHRGHILRCTTALAHCGKQLRDGDLVDLPRYAEPGAFVGSPRTLNGCGNQFRIDLETETVCRCAGEI